MDGVKVWCDKKYCRWNELGECKKDSITIVESYVQEVVLFDLVRDYTIAKCQDMEIIGNEA